MPFTDEQPFLDAVFAQYHDDGPRLIYADFLEDAGDPARAELIRLQLALARMPDEHPRRPELANRERELLVANHSRWTGHLADLIAGPPQFRRGVLDSVSVDSAVFLERGEELFARVPVRKLRLVDDAGLLPKLIHSPLMARVRELDLHNNDLGNGGVDLLARSPHLKRLEELDLSFNGMDDEGVSALARASTFPSLTALALNDNGAITADGLKTLADSPFFAGLSTLDVSGNDIGEAGVRAALDSPSFARLNTLKLSRNPIGDAGARALAGSALLGRMVARSARLELRGHANGPISAAGARALAASPALARCAVIDLTGNDIGDAGFAALAGSPLLTEVRVLKLARNQITDAGIDAIRPALTALLARLRLLDLSENRLTNFGMGLLQRARGQLPVIIEDAGNVQSAAGPAPIQLGEVVKDVLRDAAEAAEAAELRRRVAHPRSRPGDRPNPTS
jgi:uncharacterized protein (TIGR02996 family)